MQISQKEGYFKYSLYHFLEKSMLFLWILELIAPEVCKFHKE